MATDQEIDYEALLQFLYMAPIGIAQTCIDGEIVMVNPLCAQLLMPLSRDGGLSNLFTALESVAPELRQRTREFADGHGLICDALQIQLNAGAPGKVEPKILSLSLLKLDETQLMAVLNDVTQAVKREHQLRQSEAWFNAIFAGVTDYAMTAIDASGQVVHWNPSIERLTGFDAPDVLDRSFAVFYPPGNMTSACMADRQHEADHTGWSLDEGWRMRADGSRFWGSCLIAPLQALNDTSDSPAEPRSYSLIIRDITAQRESNEALRRAVSCDPLTGLSNRRTFLEAVELEVRRWQRAPRALSMVLLDVDRFKTVNDRCGHVAGDAVLRALATCIRQTAGEGASIARVGGEEFAVLLPGKDLQQATTIATRLCEQVAALAVDVGGSPIRFTVSAGVASMASDVPGVDALIRRADTAKCTAKAQGRNRAAQWHAADETALLPADAMAQR